MVFFIAYLLFFCISTTVHVAVMLLQGSDFGKMVAVIKHKALRFSYFPFFALLFYRSGDDYDNCLLSDEPFGSLDTSTDLDYDLSWNVYRLSDQDCNNENYNDGKSPF